MPRVRRLARTVDLLEDRESTLNQVHAPPTPDDRPEGEPRANSDAKEGSALRRLDRAETDFDRVIPAAGDKVCLCRVVVDPGHLVHETACLRELCGAFDLGQRSCWLVADEGTNLRTHCAGDELPAAAGTSERLDFRPALPLQLVVTLRAGGHELKCL